MSPKFQFAEGQAATETVVIVSTANADEIDPAPAALSTPEEERSKYTFDTESAVACATTPPGGKPGERKPETTGLPDQLLTMAPSKP